MHFLFLKKRLYITLKFIQTYNQESEVIWTNKKEINKEEERNLLLKQLFETSELENKLPILEKLQKLN